VVGTEKLLRRWRVLTEKPIVAIGGGIKVVVGELKPADVLAEGADEVVWQG